MASLDLDAVVDALAGVLRDYGKHAFDLSHQDARKTQSTFDQWAQHVAVGAAPPVKGASPGPRRLAEVRAAFAAHRQTEKVEVTASHDALKDVVWAFVASLNRVTREDRQDDSRVGSTLVQLVAAAEESAVTDIRALALKAVREVQQVVEAREKRRAQQVLELVSRVEALGGQLEVAKKESTTDALTLLFNRRAFDEQLVRVHDLATLKRTPAALLVVDVDHFKKVNDVHGHPGGDAVLRAVAEACVRTCKGKNDFVARYGGEELAILLTDCPPSDAVAQAERVRTGIARLEVAHAGKTISVTVSVGVAMIRDGEGPLAWLARADDALYRAKNAGRNRVVGP